MVVTLDEVVQAYLADTEFQRKRQTLAEAWNASIPALQALTLRFIRAELHLQDFRAQLERTLRAGEDWGATGLGFMMQLNTLGKYHDEAGRIAENELRSVLTDLDAHNVGMRIERFYNFLLKERERLHREGKRSSQTAAPGNSAFIISLFAFWLAPSDRPIIYYKGMRKGLYQLVKAEILPSVEGLQLGSNSVEIRSDADHKACLQLINTIERQAPEIAQSTYWTEYFGQWVDQRFQSVADTTSILIKETDEAEMFSRATPPEVLVKDEKQTYELTLFAEKNEDRRTPFISNEPLQALPEPLVAEHIREVQRSILIDEATVRRIYHALLAGHVILTGPPGTGKTELARVIPEILWKSETRGAYTTRLVTATGEWSVRTLIGGITPQSKDGAISYGIQYGYLTTTILKNWSFDSNKPEEWNALRRTTIVAPSGIERGTQQTFRGQWLVIDEFNRAPIDVALGDALTALSGGDNEALRVPIKDGSAELPIPRDFRIIGTLNSFDRTFLNQISEALKRRFAFIEILPPTRAQRLEEQGIVLYKSLKKITHLSDTINMDEEETLTWQGGIISADTSGFYTILWEDEQHPFREAFELAWRIFEVIRIYRQLGTAQAISLVRHMLIAGIIQAYTTRQQWIEEALDQALCDTLADQLQVLLPDEIETLLLYLTRDQAEFSDAYNSLLGRLTHDRVYALLLALGSVTDSSGQALLSASEIERIAAQDTPEVPAALLADLFHTDQPRDSLPQFTRRLHTFRAERGL